MKLVVFGATGRIGRQVVLRALEQGHRVVAVSRRPESVSTDHQNLTAAAGDVLEPDSLNGLVASADAVVFAVGRPGRSTTVVRSAGIVAVTKAMQASGVSRLVAVSPSAAVISPRASLARKIALRFFLHKLYHNPFNDAVRMEDELRYTKADWSVVRAPTLRDSAATGRYQVMPDGQVRHERPVSVADLAAHVVAAATDKTARRDVVTLTGTA